MTEPTSGQFPDHPNDAGTDDVQERERRLASAIAEYLDLQANEETVDIAAFCRAHPDLEPELRAGIEALMEIERMAQPSEPLSQDDNSEDFPERLSGHKILSEIGSGGMGRVLLAVDERLGRKVAIKVLSNRYRDNVALRTRFMQEAKAMARLSHPNIVHIYNLGQPDEPPHFVMEYLEGASLMEAAQALTLRQKVELMHKVVLAVDFLHQHQVIHRDLKPANIRVGADLEPKLLDFGLALQVDDGGKRLTTLGEVMGTPHYFSPEQARGDAPLDARSDIFSLGTILYELLTGVLPFRAETFSEQVHSICRQDPILPRRLNRSIPGDLQNICMKALEKNPADRYGSAREMADDLERFLAGEKVLAAPKSYSDLMSEKIDQHVRELEGWKQDQILSEYEFDALKKGYDRLVEREDAWIMEVRRLSLPQVSLYLGAWILVVGAALVFLFRYLGLSGSLAVLVVSTVTIPTAYYGIHCWKQGRLRIGVAYLLAFCLLLPSALLVAMGEYRIFGTPAPNPDWELFWNVSATFKKTTNTQLWWSIFLSLPAYLWLRRFTRSSVFSLVFAVMAALLSLVTLLRMGMLEWLQEDPGKFYFRLIPIALLFFATAFTIERMRQGADSRYFYPIAVVFTFTALSGLAGFHKPYAEWLGRVAPWTREQVEYLFIINAGIYFALQGVSGRFPSAQMRTVAKSFRFVIPGHVLTSMLLLGLEATRRWDAAPHDIHLRLEARTFEILLPLVACLFVFGSIPKQMKNYLATGMLFLAIGIIRLQQDIFKERAQWPILLLITGLLLMVAATKYSAIKMTVTRWGRRKS